MLDHLGSSLNVHVEEESDVVELIPREERDRRLICNSFCPHCMAAGTGPSDDPAIDTNMVYCDSFLNVIAGGFKKKARFDVADACMDPRPLSEIMSCWRLLGESAQIFLSNKLKNCLEERRNGI